MLVPLISRHVGRPYHHSPSTDYLSACGDAQAGADFRRLSKNSPYHHSPFHIPYSPFSIPHSLCSPLYSLLYPLSSILFARYSLLFDDILNEYIAIFVPFICILFKFRGNATIISHSRYFFFDRWINFGGFATLNPPYKLQILPFCKL